MEFISGAAFDSSLESVEGSRERSVLQVPTALSCLCCAANQSPQWVSRRVFFPERNGSRHKTYKPNQNPPFAAMPIVSNPMLQAWSVDLARRYALTLTLCTCQNNATTPARQISCCAATSPRLEEHPILDSPRSSKLVQSLLGPGLPAPSIGSRAALTRHACSQGSGEWLPSTLAHTAHRAQFHLEVLDVSC
jgi:hypothetical protein